MKITVNSVDISNRLINYKIAADMSSDSLLLGNAVAKQITMKLDNQDNELSNLLDYPFIIQNDSNKTGTFYVYERPEKYTGELSLTLYDNMYLFSQRYDTKLNYPTTIEDQIDEMSLITGVSIDKTNLRTETLQKIVDWYDNTVSMRNYLGWIAELDGCNVFADPNGSIVFRDLATATYPTVDIETYEKGDLVHFTKVCFDDGILKIETGTNDGNTLYLSSNNGYIDSDTSLDFIKEKYDNLQFYSVKNVKMANIDGLYLTDLVNYNNEFIFMPLSVSEVYSGGTYSIASVSGEINSSNNEMIVNKIDNSVKIRRIQTIVDKNNQTLKILAEDLNDGLGKISEFELTLESISQNVSRTEQKIEEIELKPTISIKSKYSTQQVYSPASDVYTPDWCVQYQVLTPELKVQDVVQSYDASKISWSKKSGQLSANETVQDGILTISDNILSDIKTETYVVTYSYDEDKSVSAELSFSLVSDGSTGQKGENGSSCSIIASSTAFTTSDGETYVPSEIALTPQCINCGYESWQYSADGLNWSDVVSGKHCMSVASDGILTVTNETDLLSDDQKSLNIKLLTSQLNVVSTITIIKVTDGWDAANSVRDELNATITTVTDQYSRLEQTTSEISSTVSDIKETTTTIGDDLEAFKKEQTETNTKMSQDSESVLLSINKINTTIDEMGETVNQVSTYFEFNEDGLLVGKSDSVYKSQMTNTGFNILKRDNIVGKFNESGLETLAITLQNGGFLSLPPLKLNSYENGWIIVNNDE